MDEVTAAREQVSADLRQGGPLSQKLPGYEERAGQIAMAEAVAMALATGQHALIEAGTGIGKSIAYLLPIVRSGKKAIVATANKALQEQLYYKDLPFISQHIAPVDFALVKGMGNYLCRQHFEEERAFQQLVQQPAFSRLDKKLDDRDFDGDLDVLPFSLPGDLRGRVAADGDDCAWRACDHFNACFVRQMRDRAQAAQIIIVNHTLLLIDTLMDGWLLPEREVVVVDEAHHLPDEATRAFTVTVSPRSVDSLLSLRLLREHCDPQKIEMAIGANAFVWARLEEMISFGSRNRVPFAGPLQEGLRLSSAIKEIGTSLRQRRPENMSEREEQLFDKLLRRVSNLTGNLALVFGESDTEKFVYYVERTASRRGRDAWLSISAAPLSVTDLLKKNLFDKGSVIATSATLAINGSFEFYRRQTGLDDVALEHVFPSPFDYRTNARIFVPGPSDIPEPSFGAENRDYLDKLAELMARLVRASRGRAFLLFTSQRALNEVLRRFVETHRLEDEGFTLLVQGYDIGRKELLDRFRAAEQAVLLGLRSFWEGVDVVGDRLSLVVIDKLPFAPPDDPVHEARVSQMRAAGENWFGDYVLPLAIMQLKQGVGRLIRSRDDRGVIAILDSRLIAKYYGRTVLLSLPDALRTRHMRTIEAFFAEEEDESGRS
jgi:Rad3-related DNA helicase